MKYAVQGVGGSWTGVVYEQASGTIVAHHAAMGERVIAVADIVETKDGYVEVMPDIETARAVASARFMDWVTEVTTPLIAKYPRVERDMWPMKLPAAFRIQAGAATELDTLLFQTEATIAGSSVRECVDATISKGLPFVKLSSAMSGLRQKLEAALAQITAPEDVAGALALVMADAENMASLLGVQTSAETIKESQL